jgi:hypothetical protein
VLHLAPVVVQLVDGQARPPGFLALGPRFRALRPGLLAFGPDFLGAPRPDFLSVAPRLVAALEFQDALEHTLVGVAVVD